MEDLTGLINSMKCMQQQLIKISLLKNNTGQVEGLPKNPRLIKDQKYAKLKASLEADPEMMELREVIAYDNDGELVVICGNMRLRALKELGVKEVPVKVLPKETPPEKLKAYTIKDNVPFGEHDWSDLANEWDSEQLSDWGVDFPVQDFEQTDSDIEKEELKPYKRHHVLISFHPDIFIEVAELLEKISQIEGVEYEQSNN